MDLDGAADQLYAVLPEDFMARRTALAAEAKESGNKALAKQITGLRRPTRSAWLVNLLARTEPERMAELRELGTALQQAQQQMAGDELRRLSRERRTMIDSLARRSTELAAEHGYDAPDSAVQEVSQTLQAALGDPGVAEVVQAGQLHQAVTYGGFGPDDLASALAASVRPSKADSGQPEADSKKDSGQKKSGPDHAEDDAEARAAAEKAKKARDDADAARAAADEAETAADEATAHADELADQLESLRQQLRDTEAAEREAREAARAARKRYTELLRDAAAAERAATRAEQT